MPHSDSDSADGGIPLVEDLSDSDSAARRSSTKRKRDAPTTTDGPDDADLARRAAKRAKRKASKASKKAASSSSSTTTATDAFGTIALAGKDGNVNTALAHMAPAQLADLLAQRLRRYGDAETAGEVGLDVPAAAIRDTVDIGSGDAVRELEVLPEFLIRVAGGGKSGAGNGGSASANGATAKGGKSGKSGKGGKKAQPDDTGLAWAPAEKGTPHTLVVAGAGLRAAEVARVLRARFQTPESRVAKLFAKHIKLGEAVEMVRTTRMGIGVGTPQRLIDLLEEKRKDGGGAVLRTEKLQRIVVDASHVDQKKRGVLDMRETLVPLMRLLGRKEFKERYGTGEGKLELLFY